MTPQIEQARKVFQQRIDWNNQSISQTGDPDGFMRNENNAYELALRVLGRVDSFELSQKQLGEIIMFIRQSMFLPENDKMAELNKLIKQAILQSLIAEEK